MTLTAAVLIKLSSRTSKVSLHHYRIDDLITHIASCHSSMKSENIFEICQLASQDQQFELVFSLHFVADIHCIHCRTFFLR